LDQPITVTVDVTITAVEEEEWGNHHDDPEDAHVCGAGSKQGLLSQQPIPCKERRHCCRHYQGYWDFFWCRGVSEPRQGPTLRLVRGFLNWRHNEFRTSLPIPSLLLPLSHGVWLRDHCQCPQCHHPETQQRLLDTFSVRETGPLSFGGDHCLNPCVLHYCAVAIPHLWLLWSVFFIDPSFHCTKSD